MSIAIGVVKSLRGSVLQKTMRALNPQIKIISEPLQKSRLILPAIQDTFETAAKSTPKATALENVSSKPVQASMLSPKAEFGDKFYTLFGPKPSKA